MSSNNPYGGSQPPWPGQGSNAGPVPGQAPGPYGYAQQPRPDAPDSGYSFGPFAPDDETVGARRLPPDPYRAPSGPYGGRPTRRAPEPKGKGKIWIIIGAAAVAVLLIAVLAVVLTTRNTPKANPGGNTSTAAGQQTNAPQSTAPQATRRPSDAVAAYLQALAAGDANAALSYAADPAPTGPLLTNEVLAKSLERTPLTGIHVPTVEDQNATSASATYRFGDSAVSESFDVVKVGGSWKLSHAVKDLDLTFMIGGSVPLKINGVKVKQDSVAVLPGSYAFTTGLPYIGYGSKNVVLVKSPYAEADTYRIQSQLTKSGKKAVISAARKRYNKCLNVHSLTPKNCPMKFSSKYSYDKNTITWRQAGGDPFKDASLNVSGTQVRIEIPLNLKLSGSCTYKSRSGNCTGTLTGTSVAIVKLTTKPPSVKWQ
jgi:hypothetical protein